MPLSSSSSFSALVVALRAIVFFFLLSSSDFCCIISSWVINEPSSFSRGRVLRSFASYITVTFAFQVLGRDQRIFLTISELVYVLPRFFKQFIISMKRVNMLVIVLFCSIWNISYLCTSMLILLSLT